MDFKISKENRDALLQYLMTRPFSEVEGGVAMLRSLEPIEEDGSAQKNRTKDS